MLAALAIIGCVALAIGFACAFAALHQLDGR
jgi:hypothetical protein